MSWSNIGGGNATSVVLEKRWNINEEKHLTHQAQQLARIAASLQVIERGLFPPVSRASDLALGFNYQAMASGLVLKPEHTG